MEMYKHAVTNYIIIMKLRKIELKSGDCSELVLRFVPWVQPYIKYKGKVTGKVHYIFSLIADAQGTKGTQGTLYYSRVQIYKK